MKRICIIGCGGSGKSTLAIKMGALLGIPVIHLDAHYWNPGWQASTPEEWQSTVERIISNEKWIMDGNYGGTMDIRFARADTIVFLNPSTWKCIVRVLKRTWNYRGKTRPSGPEGCPERFSWKFLHYILMYNFKRVPRLLQKLRMLSDDKAVYILKSNREIQSFMNQFSDS